MLKVCAENEADKVEIPNKDFLEMFLDAKKIEGCSEKNLAVLSGNSGAFTFPNGKFLCEKLQPKRYGHIWLIIRKTAIVLMLPLIIFEEIYQAFFSWLEEEDYILKSPMRRIHKIKTKTVVKNTISDESIEKLRDHCTEIRDLAIIDLLYSTGIRVGELVNLNIDDIDLEGRECIVYGKGDKERRYILTPRQSTSERIY